ncbi:MAG TPA: YciI family protein [Kineosporiaceae bacterium]|jgi:hypothetical protein|nr:YciI family protein [Kineosporiaceae bacterium]
MAKYAILIYGDPTFYEHASPEAAAALLDAHNVFAKAIAENGGSVLGGEALEPTSTATTIRGGAVTDGPFVETKEALGGFYLIEARDLDHALALAKLTPAPDGGVEVRPLMVFPEG